MELTTKELNQIGAALWRQWCYMQSQLDVEQGAPRDALLEAAKDLPPLIRRIDTECKRRYEEGVA